MSEDDICEKLELVGWHEKNFIGFIDSFNITLQFYVDEVDKIWVEIPVPEENGSYGKHISQEKMVDIVKNIQRSNTKYIKDLNLQLDK
ncbi:hypothetical protein AB4622_22205 [Vibrio splendidus]